VPPSTATLRKHGQRLITRKSLASLNADYEKSDLKRNLNAFDLTMVGIGGIIGAGIFVLTGTAAASKSPIEIVLFYMVSIKINVYLELLNFFILVLYLIF
jgi:amino acid permease